MGGYGSGRSGSRPVAEHSLAFPIRLLLPAVRALDDTRVISASNIVRWTVRDAEVASIGYRVEQDIVGRIVRLLYRYRDEPVDDPIRIVVTTPHFGGQRWWWQCSRCGRRVGVLYAPGVFWRCRTCYRITYTSSNESHQYDALFRSLGFDPAVAKLLERRYRRT